MSDPAPFDRRGLRINWASIWKAVFYLIPVGLAAVLLYLSTIFVAHTDLQASTAPYVGLPAKVQSLEEFKTRQEVAQTATTVALQDLRVGQATQAAQLTATDKKIDRVLDVMERMNRSVQP